MLVKQENCLRQPSLWEDPFENLILKSPVRLSNGETGEFEFHGDLYGQCWTLGGASDAMWRIYSPDKKAVRLRTTVRKALEGLAHNFGDWAHTQAFIGRVRYLSDRKIKEFVENAFQGGLTPRSCAESLLVKRAAFKHEREVRLVYFERSNQKHPKGNFLYPIAHGMIDQIMIDPRVSYDEFKVISEDIKQRSGFSGRILRSLLYAPPKGFVVRIE